MSLPILDKVKSRWHFRIWVKCAAWLLLPASIAVVMHLFGTMDLFGIACFGFIALVLLTKELLRLPQQSDVVSLINRQYSSAEYSTDLLVQKPESPLQALQQDRVQQSLATQLPRFKYPIFWHDLLLALFLSVGGFVLFQLLIDNNSSSVEEDFIELSQNTPLTEAVSTDSIYLSSYRIYSSPPVYTGIRTKKESSFDLTVPEQSEITWDLKFNGNPEHVWLKFSNGDSVPLKQAEDKYRGLWKAVKGSLYTVNFIDADEKSISSPFYELKTIPDKKPEIVVSGIPSFQRIDYKPDLSVSLNVSVSDDYGLTGGHLVATITKGSGESVKFREQEIALPGEVTGRKVVYPVSFNLDALDMEPGNELYFYVTAFDNRTPKRQQTRTDTYFVVLRDTAEVEFSLQGALGVDLMPDFFRSQLQIIIDTKKLIEDKGSLSEYDFKSKSNALGYDQKQLRLKYGQFIGEEEDSGLEVQAEPADLSTDGEDVLDEFGHDTDAENEKGQWMDRVRLRPAEDHDHDHAGHDHDHDHGDENETVSDGSELLEQFMHNHEDEETATFYTQSLKSKLKSALSEMWDAELHLRLYDPKSSLPYQLRAQKLLKEIRNHARIYVQRIGFDPPPVNVDESRLTGKLKQLNSDAFLAEVGTEEMYPAMLKAIQMIESMDSSNPVWNDDGRSALQDAGNELAGLAVENPGKYLGALNTLKQIAGKENLGDGDYTMLVAVQRVLEIALPKEAVLPSTTKRPQDDFTEAFVEAFTKSEKP